MSTQLHLFAAAALCAPVRETAAPAPIAAPVEPEPAEPAPEDEFADVFEIPFERWGYFEKRFAGLARKATRLGSEGVGFTTIGTKRVYKRGEYGIVGSRAWRMVRVHGSAPRLPGEWKLLGRLDFSTTPPLRAMAPGETYPADELGEVTADRCDHCGKRRGRKDLFVLRDGDKPAVIVGRSCIAAHLGGVTPEQVAAYAQMVAELRSASEDGGWGARGEDTQDPQWVLTLAAYSVRTRGWARANSYDGSTRGDVTSLLYPPTGNDPASVSMRAEVQARLAEVSERDHAKGAAAQRWAASLDVPEGGADYLYNLKVAAANPVTSKTMGVLVSGVVAYDRAMEREVKRVERQRRGADADALAQAAGHFGKVGERVEVEGRVLFTKAVESRWGSTTIVKFQDDAGHLFTWFASNAPELGAGDTLRGKATVKKHDDFRGVPQTVVTRLTLHAVTDRDGNDVAL